MRSTLAQIAQGCRCTNKQDDSVLCAESQRRGAVNLRFAQWLWPLDVCAADFVLSDAEIIPDSGPRPQHSARLINIRRGFFNLQTAADCRQGRVTNDYLDFNIHRLAKLCN
jgi:hypothetical protein